MYCSVMLHTLRRTILGGLKGYSGGRMILPWYRPPSNSVSLGPRIVKCHSNILSYGVELVE